MDRIKFLLSQYLANKADREEIAEMLRWLRENQHNEQILQQVWEEQPAEAPPADLQRIWLQIEAETTAPTLAGYPDTEAASTPVRTTGPVITLFRRYWPAVAAALLLLITAAYLLLDHDHNNRPAPEKQTPAIALDVAPGQTGAILTLADGSHVSLDNAGKGLIATQNSSKILLSNGQVTYQSTAPPADHTPLIFNSISTPRGRQFALVLPDGSRVWLNAASSIKFPTEFTGDQRRVELIGEAYFEVAKDKNKPFFVHTMNSETEVLGTSFNINAYGEEDFVKATLLDGSISTGGAKKRNILQPGEQAQITAGGTMTIDHHANLDQVMAWKNGAFNFQNLGLKEVMRQLARWYDLEIVYEQGVTDVKFGGEMSRNVPLSSLLKGLKDMDVHFRIEEGHKLIVMP